MKFPKFQEFRWIPESKRFVWWRDEDVEDTDTPSSTLSRTCPRQSGFGHPDIDNSIYISKLGVKWNASTPTSLDRCCWPVAIDLSQSLSPLCLHSKEDWGDVSQSQRALWLWETSPQSSFEWRQSGDRDWDRSIATGQQHRSRLVGVEAFHFTPNLLIYIELSISGWPKPLWRGQVLDKVEEGVSVSSTSSSRHQTKRFDSGIQRNSWNFGNFILTSYIGSARLEIHERKEI